MSFEPFNHLPRRRKDVNFLRVPAASQSQPYAKIFETLQRPYFPEGLSAEVEFTDIQFPAQAIVVAANLSLL
jgi:hypothetical protein